MTTSIASLLQSGIQSALNSATRHLNAETRDSLLGPSLAPLVKKGTGKTVLTQACFSDGMRVVFNALMANGETSEKRLDQAESFLTVVAARFAKDCSDYAQFASLTREEIIPFLQHYQSDSSLFGFKDDSTKWAGVRVLQNIAEQCGDPSPLDTLRDTLLKTAEALLLADESDDEASAVLTTLKREFGLRPGGETQPEDPGMKAEVSEVLPCPLRFPKKQGSEPAAFSPIDSLLAIGGEGIVSIWNLKARTLLRVIYGKRNAWVKSLAFSADGHRIAIYFDDDYKTRVFDVASGERVCLLDGQSDEMGYERDMLVCDATQSGTMVTATGYQLHRWNLANAEKVSSIRVGCQESVKSMCLDRGGALVTAALECDDDLRVFDLRSSTRVGTCFGRHECEVECVVAGAVPGTVFSIDNQGGLAAWRIPSGEMVRQGKVALWAPKSMRLTPCGSRLILSGWSNLEDERGLVLIIDAETFAVLHSIPTEDRPVLALSGDGNLLAFKPSSESGLVVMDLRSTRYSLEKVANIKARKLSETPEWDEDRDPIPGEEEINGTFDPSGWTLPIEGDLEWADLLEVTGSPREASLFRCEEWQIAQAENRVLTIEHAGDGTEYVGRVGLSRGLNLCRIVVGCSLPDGIRVVNVDVSDIDCDFSAADEYGEEDWDEEDWDED